MKLSTDTIDVLKNFSSINSGIYFKQGTKLATVSSNKNILAEAGIKDEIPSDFAIYDLNNLLQLLSLEKDCPDLEFDDKNVIIKTLNGRSKIKYRFAAKEMIVTPPEKRLTLPTVDVQFTLSEGDFGWIMKTASILSAPHVMIENSGDGIKLTACDAKDDSKSTNSIGVGDDDGKKYKFTFSTENLKMVPGSYDVEVCAKGLAHFKNKAKDIQYWIALEPKFSKFEG